LPEERVDVGDRTEVLQLVRVDHGSDRLHRAVVDVEREHVRDPPLGVEHERAGLAVHVVELEGDAQLGHLLADPGEELAHAVPADDRSRPRRRVATAVAVDDDVGSEHLDERIDVPLGDRVEEPRGQAFALLPRRFEAGLPVVDVTACTSRELPTVVRPLADDLGDLVEAVAEDVVEQEDRALDRVELLEQDEERERERVRLLGVAGRVAPRVVVGEERLREPLAHVDLAARLRRAQVIDAEPRDDRGQKRLRRFDLGPLTERPLLAEERLLDDVLRLGDAAEHPVGEREEHRAQRLEALDRGHR